MCDACVEVERVALLFVFTWSCSLGFSALGFTHRAAELWVSRGFWKETGSCLTQIARVSEKPFSLGLMCLGLHVLWKSGSAVLGVSQRDERRDYFITVPALINREVMFLFSNQLLRQLVFLTRTPCKIVLKCFQLNRWNNLSSKFIYWKAAFKSRHFKCHSSWVSPQLIIKTEIFHYNQSINTEWKVIIRFATFLSTVLSVL